MSAPFKRPTSVRRLQKEETVELSATQDECDAIGESLAALVDELEARFTLRPWREEGVRVTGTVEGLVTQPCVVTFEPVVSTVRETVDRRFHPDAAPAPVDVDPDAPDPPEPLEGDMLDLGAIALEHFTLGLPQYPRAQGATFEPPHDGDAPEPSPFAVLAALKNKPN